MDKITYKDMIESIGFRSAEGWATFTLVATSDKCTGMLPQMIEEGDVVTVTGEYVVNPKYGKQFACESIIPEPPDTSSVAGVVRLLQKLPGIGPKKAQIAVETHGYDQAWYLAQHEPCKIGVLPQLEEVAKEVASAQVVNYEALTYLLGLGCTDHEADKIIKRYGKKTISNVSEMPYDMINDIDGFGFKKTDKIALKAGVAVGSEARCKACVVFILEDSKKNGGNIWIYGRQLVDIVIDTLKESAVAAVVPIGGIPDYDLVRKWVYQMTDVIVEQGKVYSKKLRDCEQLILDSISDKKNTQF